MLFFRDLRIVIIFFLRFNYYLVDGCYYIRFNLIISMKNVGK